MGLKQSGRGGNTSQHKDPQQQTQQQQQAQQAQQQQAQQHQDARNLDHATIAMQNLYVSGVSSS